MLDRIKQDNVELQSFSIEHDILDPLNAEKITGSRDWIKANGQRIRTHSFVFTEVIGK